MQERRLDQDFRVQMDSNLKQQQQQKTSVVRLESVAWSQSQKATAQEEMLQHLVM